MKRTTLTLAAAFLVAMGTAPAAPAQPTTVHIRDFAFQPATLRIHVGDRVKFVNDDGEAHSVAAVDRTFASPGLDTGDTWAHAFTKAGTFSYICSLHPYMKGTIVVLGHAS